MESDLHGPAYRVESWGDTKDTEPHEFVELIVEIVSTPVVQVAAVPALAFLGGVLSDVFKSLVVDAVKDLVVKFKDRGVRRDISDVSITLPDGSLITIRGTDIQLSLIGRSSMSFDYNNPPKT